MTQGMKGATVRKIASEAGLSLGALRHYFSTQQELLDFAMNLVKERVYARIQDIAMSDLPPKQKIINMLLQLVPIDETTMAEMEVWFSFTFYRKNGDDRLEVPQQHDSFFTEMAGLISYLDQHELLRKELDHAIEAERLYALIDGLALHALLEPERLNPERIIRLLTQHIDSICVG